MDTDELRAFVTAAREGRLTAAARRLGVSQPGLSRRIQRLEQTVGARLLVRAASGLVPTAAGERFLAHAIRALAALDAAAGELGELGTRPHGTVSLGAMPTVGTYALPDVLARFHAAQPDVLVRVREALPEALEAGVTRGDLDLALLNLPVRHVELAVQKLWQEDYVLLVRENHRLARARRAVPLTDIADEPLVVIPDVPPTAALRAACDERGVRPRIVLEVDNHEAVRRMVERGLGVALVPRLMTAHGAGKGLVVVEVGAGGLRRQVALVHRGRGDLTAAARALQGELVATLRRLHAHPVSRDSGTKARYLR